MACEITAVNDDLDDATIAFIEKHASILDEEDPFLCFIDELDDHRAIFRSMDQLSRLSFTSTMILIFQQARCDGEFDARSRACVVNADCRRAGICFQPICSSPASAPPCITTSPTATPTVAPAMPTLPLPCPCHVAPAHVAPAHAAPAHAALRLSCPSAGAREGSLALPTDLGLKGAGRLNARGTGRAAGRTLDGGSANNTPRCSCSTSTRWYMGTRMPNAQEVPM
ncbi:hypothetical protein PAPYR_13074 [Paratrimastix pyriformis]|uniref:Uncharacterized protein n=1 Tax=Paratrimastix pyriformis TaxID=342808 RepID=A0ABQ8U4I8_9EUKA|nr:hypothetical protein PAPYR_13074 [Paratrimastix pyriformis]